jgi:hypothetical protein
MEPLMNKMREYLQMDTEIPFTEFRDYYEQLLDYLQKNYDGLNNDELIQTRYILDIVGNNGQTRATRKDLESKKYKKISEKCSFWSDAVNFRLQKNGMTQQEIDERIEQLNEAS